MISGQMNNLSGAAISEYPSKQGISCTAAESVHYGLTTICSGLLFSQAGRAGNYLVQ